MGLDQTGHQSLAAAVDDEVGIRGVGAGLGDGGDAVALDEHVRLAKRGAGTVEQGCIADENSHFHSSAWIGLAPLGSCFGREREKIK